LGADLDAGGAGGAFFSGGLGGTDLEAVALVGVGGIGLAAGDFGASALLAVGVEVFFAGAFFAVVFFAGVAMANSLP